MTIPEFISQQEPSRQNLLNAIHDIIVKTDETVDAKIGKMMGKEMILYMAGKPMKYGLASMKGYLSLHVMPMYGYPSIYEKYKKLLSSAKFQKGCINFKTSEDMPTAVVKELISDCVPINLVAIMEEIRKNSSRKYL